MNTHDAEIVIRACGGVTEYPALVEIWRSAVLATHHFLNEGDFEAIEGNLSSLYFPAVELKVAERNGEAVGFSGVSDGILEMLFVSNTARGTGIGSALLSEAIRNQAATRVDVNEQNSGALGFYRANGFVQVGRSELDGDGRPYPLLHLEIRP